MKTNSGALRSRFPSSYSKKSGAKLTHLFKGGNGRLRVVSPNKAENVANSKVSAAQKLLQEEKQRIANEKLEKARLAKALVNKPSGEKLKEDKEGFYYQPRKNGRFLPKVRL